MTPYAWPDGSFSVSDHGLSSPSTPSSRSEQGTAPSQTWANPDQLANWYGTTENNDMSMQYHNGLGFPDYTLAGHPEMPSAPSRMSDITPTQQYSQSNMSHCPEPAQDFDSIPCPSRAKLESQFRTALSNCGFSDEEVERRIQNIDDPDGLDDITSAWWQQLDAQLRSNSAPGLPHALSTSGSFQIKQLPSFQYSEVPRSNTGFAYESSEMDLDPMTESVARHADDMSGTASSCRAPSTAFRDAGASPAEVDWDLGLFTPTASESHDHQPDSESMSEPHKGKDMGRDV